MCSDVCALQRAVIPPVFSFLELRLHVAVEQSRELDDHDHGHVTIIGHGENARTEVLGGHEILCFEALDQEEVMEQYL